MMQICDRDACAGVRSNQTNMNMSDSVGGV